MASESAENIKVPLLNGGHLSAEDFSKGPKPKMTSNHARIFAPCPDEEIVVTGVSGRFPNSLNVEELSHHLYNKVKSPEQAECNRTNSEKQILRFKSADRYDNGRRSALEPRLEQGAAEAQGSD